MCGNVRTKLAVAIDVLAKSRLTTIADTETTSEEVTTDTDLKALNA